MNLIKEIDMTENDEKLIEEAAALDCTHWSKVESMIEKADTPEAKERLRKIESALYRKEEYISGCM